MVRISAGIAIRLSVKLICRSFPASLPKEGRKTSTSTTAIKTAKKVNRIDSVKNCLTSLALFEPNTLRIPTSFERVEERAVVRFIKLIQAISKMNPAIMEKI